MKQGTLLTLYPNPVKIGNRKSGLEKELDRPEPLNRNPALQKLVVEEGKTPFGNILVAATEHGVSAVTFLEERSSDREALFTAFQGTDIKSGSNEWTHLAVESLAGWNRPTTPLPLHVTGTPFQLTVWETLLTIPFGELSTYSEVAAMAGKPKAVRAVGSAVGSNPVSLLIPCHRVVRKSGEIGQYYWGQKRKKAILEWESRHNSTLQS